MNRRRTLRGAWALVGAAALTVGMGTVASADTDDDAPVATRSARPLTGFVIAVDPGHNGGNIDALSSINQRVADGRGGLKPCNTVGTETVSGYPEHEFNLDVALRLAGKLESLGARVELTRTDDDGVGPCVDIRGRFAEDVDADLMISIHGNGSASSTAEGFFAIVADPAISPSQGGPSLDLATDLVEALTEAGLTPSTTIEDALSYRDDLATLNFARRPAVMLELGEMRNPDDAALMESEDGRQGYAVAISDGVLAWAQDIEPRD